MTEFNYGLGYLPHIINEKELAYSLQEPEDPLSLPSTYSLAKFLSPIKNQGQQGSCTGHAVTNAVEILAREYYQKSLFLSRAYTYYEGRRLGGMDVNVDSGAYLNRACDVAVAGICLESLMPYSDKVFNMAPSQAAYTDARNNTYVLAHEPITMADKILGMKAAIADNKPLVIGFYVYGEFMNTPQNNATMPYSKAGGLLGGHAICIYKYVDDPSIAGGGYFLCANSWGTNWTTSVPDVEGIPGTFRMPYQVVLAGILMEARALTVKAVPVPPQPPVVTKKKIYLEDAIAALNNLPSV